MAPAVLDEAPVTRDVRPADEEPLYEIVNGQHVDVPPMSAFATWIASRLDHRLGPFAEERGLGTVVAEMLFEYSVRRVWLVLPEARQVYVYDSPTQVRILAEAETLSGGDLLPGFSLPPASLFARAAASQLP